MRQLPSNSGTDGASLYETTGDVALDFDRSFPSGPFVFLDDLFASGAITVWFAELISVKSIKLHGAMIQISRSYYTFGSGARAREHYSKIQNKHNHL